MILCRIFSRKKYIYLALWVLAAGLVFFVLNPDARYVTLLDSLSAILRPNASWRDKYVLGLGQYFSVRPECGALLVCHLRYLMQLKRDALYQTRFREKSDERNMLRMLTEMKMSAFATNPSLKMNTSVNRASNWISRVFYVTAIRPLVAEDARSTYLTCAEVEAPNSLNIIIKERRLKHPQGLHVILWGCPLRGRTRKHLDAYRYIDEVTSTLDALRAAAPDAVIGWLAPLDLFVEFDDNDETLLTTYLILKYIVHDHKYLVLPSYEFLYDANSEASEKEGSDAFRVHIQVALQSLLQHLPADDEAAVRSYFSPPVGASVSALSITCATILRTRKYKADCLPLPSHMPPILVTGLGGSGTHAVSSRLQVMGVQAYHESITGVHGAVSWTYAANDAFVGQSYPWGKLPAAIHRSSVLSPRFPLVLHSVREPLANIASFSNHWNKTYEFVLAALEVSSHESSTSHIPAMNAPTALPLRDRWLPTLRSLAQQRAHCPRAAICNVPFAALSYLLWNELVASQADGWYRIEDEEQQTALVARARAYLNAQSSNQQGIALFPDQSYYGKRGTVVAPKIRRVEHVDVRIEHVQSLPFWSDVEKMAAGFGYQT